jgi:hypothetical protein
MRGDGGWIEEYDWWEVLRIGECGVGLKDELW